MIDPRLFIPILASFFVTLFLFPSWIKKARNIGLLWEDMNKIGAKRVVGSGGVIAVFGFIVGLFIYTAYRVFYLSNSSEIIIGLLAISAVVLVLAGVGFIDDLFGWRKGGLSIRSRLVMLLIGSIPLIVINTGRSDVALPILGNIELGLIYPFVFIPIGVLGAAFTFNILAGFNGLEAGQGIILLSAFSVVSFATGNSWLSVIGICMIASLLGFMVFNFNPAKVFPGDSIMYSVGGLLACMAIFGNFERIAVFFFIPYALESVLKLRGGLKKHSFGLPQRDGSLELRYDKIYSINHLVIHLMRRVGVKPTEESVVYSVWIFQIIVVLIGLIIFGGRIF